MTTKQKEKLSAIFESLTYMMISFLIVVVVAFGLLLVYTKVASAATIYDFTQYQTDGAAFARRYVGANFKPQADKISGISFHGDSNNYGTAKLHICYGNIDNTTEAQGMVSNCLHVNDYLASPITTFGGVEGATTTFYLDKSYNLIAGDEYYFFVEGINTNDSQERVWLHVKTANVKADTELIGLEYDGTGYYYGSSDLYFATFYDDQLGEDLPDEVELIDLPDQNQTLSVIDFDMIESVNSQLCFFNEPCYLWFSFTPDLIGEKIYAVPDVQFQQNPSFQVASTTIVDIPGNPQNALVLPEYTEATTTPLCLYLDYNGGFLYCGISVTYMDRDVWWDNAMVRIGATTTSRAEMIENACADLIAPTSTSVFLSAISIDWWLYTLRCSFQKTIVWAFEPSQEAYGAFYNNLSVMTQGFPLNIATGLYREISTNRSASSTINLLAISDSTGQVVNYLVRSDLIEQTDTYGIIPWIRQLSVFALQIFLVMYFIWRLLFNRKTNDN